MNPSRFAGGWDFEDDFSGTDDWTDAGSLIGVNTTNDNFDWDGLRSATNHAMSIQPVGATVDDTAWVLRLKLTIDALSGGSYSHYFGFGMRSVSSATGAMSGTPDSLMGAIKSRPSDHDWYFEGDNGTPWASPQMGANEFTTKPTTGSEWYELIRLSSTTASMEIFSDAFSTSVESSGSATISSAIVDLDYIIFQNDTNSVLSGSFNGTGDDVQFANGVTVSP